MIQLYHVSMVYPNQVQALSDVTLKVGRGEFVFLVGPSGAGKSTFVRLVHGEERPTRGHVIVDGRNVGRMRRSELPLLRRHVGVVFQDFKLLPDRSVLDNVAFAMLVTGSSRRDIRRRVPALLELVGLRDKAAARPNELSGGEAQRVSLARALVNSPAVVLADEPTGNLDPDTSWDIVQLLLRVNQAGTTVIMATHAKNIVDKLHRRVIAIDCGRIVRDEAQGMYGDTLDSAAAEAAAALEEQAGGSVRPFSGLAWPGRGRGDGRGGSSGDWRRGSGGGAGAGGGWR